MRALKFKKGNSELRYALYQAANVAATKVDLFRTNFTKLLGAIQKSDKI